jgi:predicted Zn-dependent protease
LSILDDIAKTYQKITEIPVKIRRLNEPFRLGAPDRIPYQRIIQEAIISLGGEKVDFKGWNKERYTKELLKVVEQKDPFNKYYAKELVQKLDKEPGQYLADPYLNWFLKMLDQYQSDDEKTMYVGITGINIYSGDNNFLFSYYSSQGKSQGSILSYFMMQAKNLSEPYELRNRLIERVAKELVPASLKSLKIPRSTDPTCPYSYSSGTERMNEKTLVLSEPVKAAIAKLKLQK